MMPLRRLYPTISLLRRKFGAAHTLEAVSTRTWVLSRQVEAESPRALFDEADLSKVTGVDEAFSGDIVAHKALAYGGRVTHRATRLFELRDVVIGGGHLFTKRLFHRLGVSRHPLVLPRPDRRYVSAALCATHAGSRFFGSWLIDDLPLTLAAVDLGHAPVSSNLHRYASQHAWLSTMDLKSEKVTTAHFDRLFVLDDVGETPHKVDRTRRLQERARRRLHPRLHNGVMFLRGSHGVLRRLVNETQVAELARSYGLTVIDPMTTTPSEIASASLGAKIVMGVEGSQLSNGLLCAPAGGAMLVLQPPRRFSLVYKGICEARGHRFAFIVGDPVDETDRFKIEPAAVAGMLDRLLTEQTTKGNE